MRKESQSCNLARADMESTVMKGEAAMRSKTNLKNLMVLFTLVSLPAFGDDVKGMITTRTGETLVVKTAERDVTVVLTDSTKTKDDRGLFGLIDDEKSVTVLIPGLKVSVDGEADPQGRFVAKTITVDGDDLETSEMIQAGLHPTAQQVAANVRAIEANKQDIAATGSQVEANKARLVAHEQQLAQLGAQQAQQKESIEAAQQKIAANLKAAEEYTSRFTALTDFEVKGDATVKFGVSSASISDEDQEALKTLAQTATGLSGYIVEVTGYTDSTGDAAMNTKLSEDRAKAVITYLMQQGGVPVRHIVAPGAMGEYGPAASNETADGRAENRRVEVKILVNKAVADK
jgi:OOP family OmpA-OmpF porin